MGRIRKTTKEKKSSKDCILKTGKAVSKIMQNRTEPENSLFVLLIKSTQISIREQMRTPKNKSSCAVVAKPLMRTSKVKPVLGVTTDP